ncbi:MAG: hypothetical protein ACTS6J_12655 [Burkholderiales bacterium]
MTNLIFDMAGSFTLYWGDMAANAQPKTAAHAWRSHCLLFSMGALCGRVHTGKKSIFFFPKQVPWIQPVMREQIPAGARHGPPIAGFAVRPSSTLARASDHTNNKLSISTNCADGNEADKE